MGAAQQQQKPVDPERLAALVARLDVTNPSDTEAMNAARMIRRMVSNAGIRFVDAMELPEVREALDRALQPVHTTPQDSPALLAAQEEAKELRHRLSVVVPKLREVTEALTREMELTAQLRQDGSRTGLGLAFPSGKPVHGGLVAVVTVIALVMLIAAAFSDDAPDVVETPAAVATQP